MSGTQACCGIPLLDMAVVLLFVLTRVATEWDHRKFAACEPRDVLQVRETLPAAKRQLIARKRPKRVMHGTSLAQTLVRGALPNRHVFAMSEWRGPHGLLSETTWREIGIET